jgi:hypothetical protein
MQQAQELYTAEISQAANITDEAQRAQAIAAARARYNQSAADALSRMEEKSREAGQRSESFIRDNLLQGAQQGVNNINNYGWYRKDGGVLTYSTKNKK